MYSELVLTHFHSPQHVGNLKSEKYTVKIGIAGGAHAGNVLHLQLYLNEDHKVENTAFKAQGCVATLALGSYLACLLKGKTFDEIKQINGIMLAHALGLPPEKMHCALLAEIALRDIIQQIEEEKRYGDINT